MKLGTETGSLVNHLFSRATNGQTRPHVGMGATVLSWTDRHAATIVSVRTLNYKRWTVVVGVQEDDARRVDSNGMSESQEYVYSPRPDAPVRYWACAANGRWDSVRMNERGRLVKAGSGGLVIGRRETYHDFSF